MSNKLKLSEIQMQDNIRTKYDKQSIKELAQSIKDLGLLQPVGVTQVKEKSKEKSTLVFGFRRFLAYELLAKEDKQFSEIPVTFLEGEYDTVAVQLVENIQREEMNPIDEAEAFQSLSSTGKTSKEIGLFIGKSEYYVASRLQLNKLHNYFKKEVKAGRITLSVAIEISKCPEFIQLELKEGFEKDSFGQSWKNNFTYVRDYMARRMKDLTKVPFDIKDNFDKLGSCLNCQKRTGANKALFPELGKEDNCLDSKCFNEKFKLHIKRVYDKMKSEGADVVMINQFRLSDEEEVKACVYMGATKIYSPDLYIQAKQVDKKVKPDSDPKFGVVYSNDTNAGKVQRIYLRKDLKKEVKKDSKGIEVSVREEEKPKQTPDQRFNRKIELISKPERTQLLERGIKEFALNMFKGEDLSKITLLTEYVKFLTQALLKGLRYGQLDKVGPEPISTDPCEHLQYAAKLALMINYESRDEAQFSEGNTKVLDFLFQNVDLKKIHNEIDKPYQSDRVKAFSKFVERNKRNPKLTKEEGYVEVDYFKKFDE